MIKSFRGKIEDAGQDRIYLSTNTGSNGYRIVKFQIMPSSPGDTAQELVTKIYTKLQTSATATVDFSDPGLLACALFNQSSNAWTTFETVIFDNEIFNQDVYVTCQDTQNAAGCNYYLELEEVKLNMNESTVVTLKDMRS